MVIHLTDELSFPSLPDHPKCPHAASPTRFWAESPALRPEGLPHVGAVDLQVQMIFVNSILHSSTTPETTMD